MGPKKEGSGKQKKRYSSYFQDRWLADDAYKDWIQKVSPTVARCKVCSVSIKLKNAGKTGLDSHTSSDIHRRLVKNHPMQPLCFFKPQGPKPVTGESSSTTPRQVTLDNAVETKQVWEAEIRWMIKCVCAKYSKRSCDNISELFKSMFPDSAIAQKFSCARTKCSYGILFGIYPYFQDLLAKDISASPFYSISFDECYNKVLHFGQMDFQVRYWDHVKKQVITRYLTSEFLQSAKSGNLLQKFDNVLSKLDMAKLLQISSDGPAVNLKFLREMDEKRAELDAPPLVDIGTCGLHTIHGSFKNGLIASEWKIEKILKWMHALLADAPARRGIFETVTGASKYPENFCKTRWCENEKCAKKAAEIWTEYKTFLRHLMGLKKSEQPKNSKSFDGLVAVVNDPLMRAKFRFAECVSWKLNEYLRGFQNDNPMLPFVCEELESLLRWFLEKFILKDTLSKADTIKKIIAIKVDDCNIRKPDKLIDIGYAAKKEVMEYKQKAASSESSPHVALFFKQARQMLQKLCSHFMMKSPLRMAVVRLAVCFDPKFIADYPDHAIIKFNLLLEKLLVLNKLPSSNFAESCKIQFSKFVNEVVATENEKFLLFNKYEDKLDSFLVPYLDSKDYEAVYYVFQMICILYHGQAAVERGFNVNKEHLVENLQEDSLIALRLINDFMTANDETPASLNISNNLVSSYKGARTKYQVALDEQQKNKKITEKVLKRKNIDEQLMDINSKRQKIMMCIGRDVKRSDELSLEAEEKQDFSLLHMANSLKDVIKQNKEKLCKLQEEEDLLKKDKNI